ncbi:proteasome subunit alpha type-5-like isoform X1 [Macadamia integrifolia]|uniref:proteasome subunit alpha type-5-like isoform X1 n=1 Tax=Macadamia integrifolia TaxID=60698 RepID=UPI001C501CC4|nr:proteasome subunit alpha type-5-like isoform X1 [Macadamia integrifolia]
MFLTRTEYDRGVNTFSPEGRLFQVEYAIEAIKLGSTAIGLKTKEGVVLAVEKRITSPLLQGCINLTNLRQTSWCDVILISN